MPRAASLPKLVVDSSRVSESVDMLIRYVPAKFICMAVADRVRNLESIRAAMTWSSGTGSYGAAVCSGCLACVLDFY